MDSRFRGNDAALGKGGSDARPFRIAAVPYLNALPLYVGLNRLLPDASIAFLPPVHAARELLEGQADAGLVPITTLFDDPRPIDHPDRLVAVSDLGVACRGEVLSVFAGSHCESEKIREVFLDPESRTSNTLVRHVLPPALSHPLQFQPPREAALEQGQARVLIGDRALLGRERYRCLLDLGDLWYRQTNLPFVFAVWAVRRSVVTDRLIETFRIAERLGSTRLDEIADQWTRSVGESTHAQGSRSHVVDPALARRYLHEHIYYRLGEPERQAIRAFSQLVLGNKGQETFDATFCDPTASRRRDDFADRSSRSLS